MKIKFKLEPDKRKELVNAIGKLLKVDPVYQGPPSFAYSIGAYTVDREGQLITSEGVSNDDDFRLCDALFAEYGYQTEIPLHELFPEDDDESEDEEVIERLTETLVDTTTPEAPDADSAEAPEIAPVAGDTPACEDEPEEAVTAPENGNVAPNTGKEPPEDEATETTEPTEESTDSNETDVNKAETEDEETKLTLSLPKEKFSPAAIDRLKALVSSKKSLLMKVLNAEDLPIVVTDDLVQFPWFTLQHIDGEVQAYSQLVYLLAKRALTSARISAVEKPTDNEKFTMRLFLNNLGFKGEEFKFARRFLIRNLEGNGAWRYGNAPQDGDVDLEMPTVVTNNGRSDDHGSADD